MDSSMNSIALIKKVEKNYKTDIGLLVFDIIFNIALVGILAVLLVLAPTIESIAAAAVYLPIIMVLVGLIILIDLIEIFVAVIFLSDNKQIYLGYTNNELILHHPKPSKCRTVPFSQITEIRKKHSGENLFGSLVKRFIGCGNVLVTFMVDDKKKDQIYFGPVKNVEAFVTELSNAKNRSI